MNQNLVGLFRGYVIYYTAFCYGHFPPESSSRVQF